MVIGIICEYNPFHNGHIYHIEKIREKYKDSILILVLNGYFTQRGELSLLTKEDKTKISLSYGVDLVIELPVFYGVQSADIFADQSLFLLHELGVQKIIFGSESNDISYLEQMAKRQLEEDFVFEDCKHFSYPRNLSLSLDCGTTLPNDLLGISYIKAILKHQYPIFYETIERTSHYHDVKSTDSIISASNIRLKWKNNQDISRYLPKSSLDSLLQEQTQKIFYLLKYKIITEDNLSQYLDVVEGLDFKLKKEILSCSSLEDLLGKLKSKRYTYSRLKRMLIHILLGIKHTDAKEISFIRILGFNLRGKKYLHDFKKSMTLKTTIQRKSNMHQYELRASILYDMIMGTDTYLFEMKGSPILFSSNDSK